MRLQYFIPDWDDRVDPRYNFITDEHTSGRNPYRDDYYAHEIYDTPPYDGILLSRAVLDDSPTKWEAIREAGSIHRYLRLPIDNSHLALGDCGAFSYWQLDAPPYETLDILEYYQELGFDLGVSVDHLIFAELETERERRWNITIDNAGQFINLHRKGKYKFTPIGVAQGWDPKSYQKAARALVKMGYGYIAVGGLVRSRTQDIIKVLDAVQEVLKPGMGVHLFGVSRPEYMAEFTRLGVTSFDSASRLRRAWMDGRHNYFIGNEAYAAIRIPDARTLAKSIHLEESRVIRAEQNALRNLRAYDRGDVSLNKAYQTSIDYAELTGRLTDRTREDYHLTLEMCPWKQCPCTVCRSIGIEVIIFRGNNRNRRRGFHNTWQLYQQLKAIRDN